MLLFLIVVHFVIGFINVGVLIERQYEENGITPYAC